MNLLVHQLSGKMICDLRVNFYLLLFVMRISVEKVALSHSVFWSVCSDLLCWMATLTANFVDSHCFKWSFFFADLKLTCLQECFLWNHLVVMIWSRGKSAPEPSLFMQINIPLIVFSSPRLSSCPLPFSFSFVKLFSRSVCKTNSRKRKLKWREIWFLTDIICVSSCLACSASNPCVLTFLHYSFSSC